MLERQCAIVDHCTTTCCSVDGGTSQVILSNSGLVPPHGHLYGPHTPITFLGWCTGPHPLQTLGLQLNVVPKALVLLRGAVTLRDGFANQLVVSAPSVILIECSESRGVLLQRVQSDDCVVIDVNIKDAAIRDVASVSPRIVVWRDTSAERFVPITPFVEVQILHPAHGIVMSTVPAQALEATIVVEGELRVKGPDDDHNEAMVTGSQLLRLAGAAPWSVEKEGAYLAAHFRFSYGSFEQTSLDPASFDTHQLKCAYNSGKHFLPVDIVER